MSSGAEESGFTSVALVSTDEAQELFCRAGGTPADRETPPPALYLRYRLAGAARLFELLKGAIRPLVRLLYIFPLLVLVKLGLRLAGIESAWITVAFVAVVVLLFALLSLLMLLFPFVGPRSGRDPRPELAIPDSAAARQALEALGQPSLALLDAGQLAALCHPGAPMPPAIRLRGRLSGGPGIDGALLSDRWLLRDDGTAVRAFAGRHFAVLAEGQPPVVVELDGAPWLAARYAGRPFALPPGTDSPAFVELIAAHDLDHETLRRDGRGYELHAGEEVELLALGYTLLHDASELIIDGRPSQLAGAAAKGPYRRAGASPCLLVRCSPTTPIVIRALGAKRSRSG